MNIGTRLQQLRKARGISVYRLSQLTYVSENHIHKIEKSERQPTIYMLETLLEPLHVSLAEFFYDGGEAFYPTDAEKELFSHIRQLNDEKLSVLIQLAKMLHEEK